MNLKSFVSTITLALGFFSLSASADSVSWAEKVLGDHEVKAIHLGAMQKYGSCTPLTEKHLSWNGCVPGERCLFNVHVECALKNRSGVRTIEIDGYLDGQDVVLSSATYGTP